MMRFRSARVTAAAVLAAAIVVVPARAGFADLTVKGDQGAWRDVQAAFAKLNTLQGYRMKSALPNGSMIVEVTLGGTAMHVTMHSAGGDVESYVMGGQARMRVQAAGAPNVWQCHGMPPMMAQTDPSKLQGTIDIARAADAVIDGAPMHVYTYTVEGAMMGKAGQAKTTVYVDNTSGLPRRMVVATTQGDQTMDYYDYDAPIKFTLPACGSAARPAGPAD